MSEKVTIRGSVYELPIEVVQYLSDQQEQLNQYSHALDKQERDYMKAIKILRKRIDELKMASLVYETEDSK